MASACVLRKAAAPAGSEHQEHVGRAAKRMETHSALLNEGWRGGETPVFFPHRGAFQRFNWRRKTADKGGIERTPFAAIRFSRANSCPQQHLWGDLMSRKTHGPLYGLLIMDYSYYILLNVFFTHFLLIIRLPCFFDFWSTKKFELLFRFFSLYKI